MSTNYHNQLTSTIWFKQNDNHINISDAAVSNGCVLEHSSKNTVQQGMMGDMEREGHRLTNWNQILFSLARSDALPAC